MVAFALHHACQKPAKFCRVHGSYKTGRPEAVTVRMQAYEQSTRPLIDFYQKLGLLVTINAEGTPEEVCKRTRLLALGH